MPNTGTIEDARKASETILRESAKIIVSVEMLQRLIIQRDNGRGLDFGAYDITNSPNSDAVNVTSQQFNDALDFIAHIDFTPLTLTSKII